MALSRYNTGSPFKGILNGYARRVIVNANAGTAEPPASSPQGPVTPADPNAPPSWNVWATAAYAQAHGAPWLIPLAPVSPTPAQDQKSTAGHRRPLPRPQPWLGLRFRSPPPLMTPLICQTGPKTSAKSGRSCSMREKRCINGRSLISGIIGIRS